MEHAFLAPSSAPEWVFCAAAPSAQKQYPQPPTDATRDGEASHWVASETLDSYSASSAGVLLPNDFIGKTAPNGVFIDKGMTDGAGLYINDILKVAQQHGLIQALQVEQRVYITRDHDSQNWGTPDCWVYDIKSNTLYVWDYKFGHKYVPIFENWQVINYTVGILDNITGGNGFSDQQVNVVMRIVQPRCYNAGELIREWRVKSSDLRSYANILSAAAEKTCGVNPTFTSGPHCTYCSARKACPGATSAAMAAIDVTNMCGSLIDLPPDVAGLELTMLTRAAEALKARITGLEAQIESLIISGTHVPGWGHKATQGSIKWAKPDKFVLMLGKAFKKDFTKNNVCTPKQAIDMGVDESVINAHTIKPTPGVKIVKYDGSLARHIFSQQKENDQ